LFRGGEKKYLMFFFAKKAQDVRWGLVGGGNIDFAADTSSPPPFPLHEFWQQECNGWSHDKKAIRRLSAKIFPRSVALPKM
jgi:hypothetical protein